MYKIRKMAFNTILFPSIVIGVIYGAVAFGWFSWIEMSNCTGFICFPPELASVCFILGGFIGGMMGGVIGLFNTLMTQLIVKEADMPLFNEELNAKRLKAVLLSLVVTPIAYVLAILVNMGEALYQGEIWYYLEGVWMALIITLPHVAVVTVISMVLVWIYFSRLERV